MFVMTTLIKVFTKKRNERGEIKCEMILTIGRYLSDCYSAVYSVCRWEYKRSKGQTRTEINVKQLNFKL